MDKTAQGFGREDRALIAFHGDKAIKAKYLNRVRVHAAADEIIHGYYWEKGKGCAVGCTIHSGEHKSYETELGIPRMLARLEDRIFEGMTNGRSQKFPVQFLTAIKPGADLTRVGWLFLHWLLTEELVGRDNPRVAKQIKACADVLIPLTKGEPADREAAVKARNEARRAYAAAYAADAADAAYAHARSASCRRGDHRCLRARHRGHRLARMADGYTKLFGSILSSTIWLEEHHVVRVWIAMLAMKNIDGVVEAAIPGLAHVARVTTPQCEEALAKFLAPDPYSRTKDHEGRRIAEVEGGWLVLNHDKYRDKLDADDQRAKANERMRKYRAKQNPSDVTVTPVTSRDVTVRHTDTDPDQGHTPVSDLPRPELPDPGARVRADLGAREVIVVAAAPQPAHARAGYDRPQRAPNEQRARLARDAVNYAALKHAELKGEGIDPTSPPIPLVHSPADYGWNLLQDRCDDLLQLGDVASAREVITRRLDVGVAEARRDRSLKYFTLPRMFEGKSFAIAAAMSPEQAAQPRAGPPRGTPTPPADSPLRRLKPA